MGKVVFVGYHCFIMQPVHISTGKIGIGAPKNIWVHFFYNFYNNHKKLKGKRIMLKERCYNTCPPSQHHLSHLYDKGEAKEFQKEVSEIFEDISCCLEKPTPYEAHKMEQYLEVQMKANPIPVKDTIDIVTGNRKIQYTDFVIKELGGDFSLTRTYESLNENKGGLLGSKWFLNIESRVCIKGDTAVVTLPNIHVQQFEKQEGQWHNKSSFQSPYQLYETPEGFSLYVVGYKRHYQYNQEGYLCYITDENNNRIALEYADNKLQSIHFVSGQKLSFSYKNGHLSTITDAIGRKICYEYQQELLTKVELPNKGQLCYFYNGNGQIEGIAHGKEKPFCQSEYDAQGRVVAQKTSKGEQYTIEYNPEKRVTFCNKDQQAKPTGYFYNSFGFICSVEYSNGTSYQQSFDDNGNLLWTRDVMGRETYFEYDKQNRLIQKKLPNGLVELYFYSAKGRLMKIRDNTGREKSYQYDKKGNCIKESVLLSDNQYQTTLFQRDSHGRIVSVTDPNGNLTQYSYTNLEPLPSNVLLPDGTTVHYTYDRAGRCVSKRNSFGKTCYTYTHMDNLSSITDPLGNKTIWEFDSKEQLVRFLSPEQQDFSHNPQAGTRFQYDAKGNLIAILQPTGGTYAFLRDSYGRIIKKVHPNSYRLSTEDGQGTSFWYDEAGHVIREQDPYGNITRYFYDAAGNRTKKVLPSQYRPHKDDGEGYCYQYNEKNQLVQITAPDGTVRNQYVYDLVGNLIKEIDAGQYLWNQQSTKSIGTLYEYNKAGWLVAKRKPVRGEVQGEVYYQLTVYRYDLAGNITQKKQYLDFQTETSRQGAVATTHYHYDTNNRLIKITHQNGGTIEYSYDGKHVVEKKQQLNKGLYTIVRWKYDVAERVIQQQNLTEYPLGKDSWAITKYQYDKNGNLLRVLFPSGGEILRKYDTINQPIEELHIQRNYGIFNRKQFQYDHRGNCIAIVENNGAKTTMEYDLLDHEIRRTQKDGGVIRKFYDTDGNLVKLVQPNQYQKELDDGKGYKYYYNNRGQQIAVIEPQGTVVEKKKYDQQGNLIEKTDAMGRTTTFFYNVSGNLTKVIFPDGSCQQKEYDAQGNVIAFIDESGNRTTYHLDDSGKLCGLLQADGSAKIYTYDLAGNVTSRTDEQGNTTKYEYNCAGKVSAIIDAKGYKKQYQYDKENHLCCSIDCNGTVIHYEHNMYGQLVWKQESKNNTFFQYTYSPDGLLMQVSNGTMKYAYNYDTMGRPIQKTINGKTVLEIAYDKNGNKIWQRDETGTITGYTYCDQNRITKVWDGGRQVAQYWYYPDGTLKEKICGPLWEKYSYTMRKFLARKQVWSGAKLVLDTHYGYDRKGNLVKKQQLSGTTEYHYDPLNRISKIQTPNNTEELFYDRVGNRVRRVTADTEECYKYDAENRMTAYIKNGRTIIFRYDNQGNLLADNHAKYTYNGWNQLVEAKTFTGETVQYRYDVEGMCNEIQENNQCIHFVFDMKKKVVLQKRKDNFTRMLYGKDLLGCTQGYSQEYYYYVDESKSITHICNQQGILQNCYDYDTWGNMNIQKETVENRFAFAGGQWHPVSGQHCIDGKFYNPIVGRDTKQSSNTTSSCHKHSNKYFVMQPQALEMYV